MRVPLSEGHGMRYLCEHDADGVELIKWDNEPVPHFVDVLECPECGMWGERDTETGEWL